MCLESLTWTPGAGVAFALAAMLVPFVAWLGLFQRFAGKQALMVANAGLVGWLILSALEQMAPALDCKLVFGGLTHMPIMLVPAAWLAFVATHVQGAARNSAATRILMYGVLPLAVVAAALTSDRHDLFYGPGTRLSEAADGPAVIHDRGLVFLAAAGYLYALIGWTIWLLLNAIRRIHDDRRGQLWLLLAITVVPTLGSTAYALLDVTVMRHDPTPFLFAVIVVAYAVMLLSGGGFDVAAMARRQVFQALPQAIFVVTRDGSLLRTNAAADAMMTTEASRRGGTEAHWREAEADLLEQFERCRAAEDGRREAVPVGLKHYDMMAEPVVPALGSARAPLGWLLIAHDVSVARARERTLTRIARRTETARRQAETSALHDPLTGLMNRRALSRSYESASRAARDTGKTLWVVVIDVDHFKAVNDGYGHDVGDLVLVSLARALRARFREADSVFRIGGEEFVILLAGLDEVALLARLSAVRQAVGRSVEVHRLTVPAISFSAGIAALDRDGEGFNALYRSADMRLLTAKAEGRDRVVTATRTLPWADIRAEEGAKPPAPDAPVIEARGGAEPT